VRQVVFLSTIKVYGDTPKGHIDEQSAPDPQDDYAASKLEAERVVLEAAARGGPVGTILRLAPVYGRGDKGNIRRIIVAIARRRFLLPGPGITRKSVVHVSTVAEVVSAALSQQRGGIFVVADREAPSMRELADAVALELGRPRPLSVPAALVQAAAMPVEVLFAALGRNPPVSRDLIWKSLQDTVCSPRKVEEELGVDCHVDLPASLGDEIEWLRERRLL
jgi:nucleoside-diphosphate-sugar epimerase